MRSLEHWLLEYLLNSLWQVPLVFVAAWAAARLSRRSGPAVEHRIWVSALLFEALLPACSAQPAQFFGAWLAWPADLWRLASRFWTAGAAGGSVGITLTSGPSSGFGYAHGLLRLPSALLAAVALAYVASLVYFAVRLLWRLGRTSVLRQQAHREPLTVAAQRTWTHCRGFFAVRDAEVAFSSGLCGPVTIGVWRRLVLLPAGWTASVSEDDLSAAIAHEFAHMRRRDFAKNLLYEVVSLPIAYHPLLWLTRARLAESRELVCDAMAAEAVAGRERYAHSLLRLASALLHGAPPKELHGIGIFDTRNFERRIMNLTQKRVELRGAQRLATACACVAIGVATCASATALRMNVSPRTEQTQTASAPAARAANGVMRGNLLFKANPVYPPAAKKAKIAGTVILRAVIGKDGAVHALKVVSGPPELRQSALDAVRQWRYRPYLHNGSPVQVKTEIQIHYSLPH